MDVPSIIVATAQKYGVQPALALEVATAESGMNPNAPDSSAGAIGIMQLMPATAASLGIDPRDPAANIDGGVRYLRQLLGQFSDVAAAIGAYNWGPTNVAKAIAQWGSAWIAHAPSETQNYVAKILGNLGTQYSVTVDPNAAGTEAAAAADAAAGTAADSPSSFETGISAAIAQAGGGIDTTTLILLLVGGMAALWLLES